MDERRNDVGGRSGRPVPDGEGTAGRRTKIDKGTAKKERAKIAADWRRKAARWSGEIHDGEYADGNLRGIVFVAGKRGSGKSWLQWGELLKCHARLIVFDTLGQYKAPKYNLRGFVVIHQPGELRAYLAGNLHATGVRVLYQPLGGNLDVHFAAVTWLVLSYGKHGSGVIYAVDE